MEQRKVLKTNDFPLEQYREWRGEGVALWWLGQAGFLIRYGNSTFVIDAYLSDVLAEKYKGKKFPHLRMMTPPIAMEELKAVDYSIHSHAHSDHMDPGLLPILRDNSPSCCFMIPEAVRATALERGIPEDQLIGLNAGNTLSLGKGISLTAIPAAHEQIKQDEAGRHFFLGYILDFNGFKIFHPGDCLPFEGFDQWLEPFNIDLALMPVNGQKDELCSEGIAGNFNAVQACQIMKNHDISYMIPQHFGMFDFNTVDRAELETAIDASGMADRIFPAEIGIMYHLIKE